MAFSFPHSTLLATKEGAGGADPEAQCGGTGTGWEQLLTAALALLTDVF